MLSQDVGLDPNSIYQPPSLGFTCALKFDYDKRMSEKLDNIYGKDGKSPRIYHCIIPLETGESC